ncbi:tRNA (adenosine(37)-N6)-dimethylallyltransferase MiaA [Metabacillus idriensis]|uniref:tRNA dimethylallyltransferase n=1 Tax=Metabacillus idriensis TaxID=324768 RepID=A0A6I2M795_9BACI|nr:tRNA (adenosine(37)-N6)-dimethylallyltransferase MiaA [Metabacillus idriensis]MCM3594211.1 tRNA (adenosine(37)-N6)-dimethylallyltransferase MiaA [Metabacillus idriensis]MRX53759.1 tRNA (adenosine(37)-N6)-dimethylallyltransferase MiaA [Metabacillus idriensis]OHR64794.1 tRNA dimethylallyltransferase [Bacillus sp. HMSC76G11]
MKKEKLVVIIGPTAVGKTNLSIQLAKKLNGEIISGDSMQVYRGLDIGTAKISPDEMDGIQHHLIDIKNPEEDFSSAEFQEIARPLISDIHARNKMPIIVGGTGLYIQSVIYDYQFTDIASDPVFRKQLEAEAAEFGNEVIHDKLAEIDSVSAGRIHPNNVRRVIRALEIFHCTGKTMTDFLAEQEKVLLYDVVVVGLTMEREQLYERINLRVDLMMDQGLIKEVKNLYHLGLRDCQSIQAIGYKELYAYFDGAVSLEDAKEQLKQNSRRYAKRQLTWFRNKMDVKWFDMSQPLDMELRFNEIFTYIAGKLNLSANT